jgi:hypothetical protein
MSKISFKSLNPFWRKFRGYRDAIILEITTVSTDLFHDLKVLSLEKKAQLIKLVTEFIQKWIKDNK